MYLFFKSRYFYNTAPHKNFAKVNKKSYIERIKKDVKTWCKKGYIFLKHILKATNF